MLKNFFKAYLWEIFFRLDSNKGFGAEREWVWSGAAMICRREERSEARAELYFAGVERFFLKIRSAHRSGKSWQLKKQWISKHKKPVILSLLITIFFKRKETRFVIRRYDTDFLSRFRAEKSCQCESNLWFKTKLVFCPPVISLEGNFFVKKICFWIIYMYMYIINFDGRIEVDCIKCYK